jgi:hypothetical protein
MITAKTRRRSVAKERAVSMAKRKHASANHSAYVRLFQKHLVRVTINTRLIAVNRHNNRLEATLGSDFGDVRLSRVVDLVVAEHGTVPADDLYFALRPYSTNGGELDYGSLMAGAPQIVTRNPQGRFQLFRIGDAVTSRNVHAAICDALRMTYNI